MPSISSGRMPAPAQTAGSGFSPRLAERMRERIAASFSSDARTGPVSPAVNTSARYSSGMRSVSMAPKRLSASSPSCPGRGSASPGRPRSSGSRPSRWGPPRGPSPRPARPSSSARPRPPGPDRPRAGTSPGRTPRPWRGGAGPEEPPRAQRRRARLGGRCPCVGHVPLPCSPWSPNLGAGAGAHPFAAPVRVSGRSAAHASDVTRPWRPGTGDRDRARPTGAAGAVAYQEPRHTGAPPRHTGAPAGWQGCGYGRGADADAPAGAAGVPGAGRPVGTRVRACAPPPRTPARCPPPGPPRPPAPAATR